MLWYNYLPFSGGMRGRHCTPKGCMYRGYCQLHLQYYPDEDPKDRIPVCIVPKRPPRGTRRIHSCTSWNLLDNHAQFCLPQYKSALGHTLSNKNVDSKKSLIPGGTIQVIKGKKTSFLSRWTKLSDKTHGRDDLIGASKRCADPHHTRYYHITHHLIPTIYIKIDIILSFDSPAVVALDEVAKWVAPTEQCIDPPEYRNSYRHPSRYTPVPPSPTSHRMPKTKLQTFPSL